MESGDSFNFGSFVFSPMGEGLPFVPPASSPPPPPLLPNHTNGDLPQSAAAAELQGWKLPALFSTPTGVELVQNHLHPAIDRLALSKHDSGKSPSRPTVVNADLPVMNPWNLPGMSQKEGRKEKYYLTDRHDLCFSSIFMKDLEAPDGFWKQKSCASALTVKDETSRMPKYIGRKVTLQFCSKGDPSGLGMNSNTNWIMDVYSLINNGFIEDELVLCHVFEENSPFYDFRIKCSKFHNYGSLAGNPRLNSYLADLENALLCDPDTSTDTDNCNPIRVIPPIADDGQSRKRKKNPSDVWGYYSKIYARDRDGNELTFAVCHHCFKLLTGGSSGGTTHLARHRCSCPCKLKPVEAGRKAQADVNVLSP